MSVQLQPMRDLLAEHMKLKAGWAGRTSPRDKTDSGEPLTLACQTTALAVIDELERDGHEARVYPRVDGGVCFEWFTEDAPRPESITFRDHVGVWLIEVDNAGSVFHFCLLDACATCDAQEPMEVV